MHRRLMLLALTLVVALTAGTVALAAGLGSSPIVEECQKGGWMNLVREDGSSFANQGDCVSYAVKGGVLMPKDTAAPVVSILSASVNGRTLVVEFDANTQPVVFSCAIDNAPFQSCISPFAIYSPLSNGWHTFQVRATDGYEITGGITSFTFMITGPPA